MSLLDMLELNARSFLGAVQQLRAIQALLQTNVQDMQAQLTQSDHDAIVTHIAQLRAELTAVGSRSALKALERLDALLADAAVRLAYNGTLLALADIEARFGDYLDDIVLLVMPEGDASLFRTDENLDEGIAFNFPSSVFEFGEAGKCLASGRHTAAMFHAMRVLEIGIRSLSKRLDIDDPIKASERNWAMMLRKIKEKIDELWPAGGRLPGSEGARVESIYATLDSVRNPWRNATMHVETIYAPHEAVHIFNCVLYFMKSLGEFCDEDGLDPIY